MCFPTARPKPVVSVSPRWFSPGASVTLSCEVKQSPAGWRFYWYSGYELLPGSPSSGTVEGSYIIHPTGTGRYGCRAGRGDPVYYTEYSYSQPVFSGGECDSSFIILLDCFINNLQQCFPHFTSPQPKDTFCLPETQTYKKYIMY